MVNIFNNVNGFNLKVPFESTDFDNAGIKREWIEFTKKPNELPTVKLRTMVLYYRDDGEETPWSSSTGGTYHKTTIPTTTDINGGNYRFYNNKDGFGAQMGSIWGFPLFDLSGSEAEHWPRFKSCIGDMSGNQKMLVDLTEQRNIIVLDCSGLGAGIFNDISDNITDLSGAFYITLRIKSSEEKVIDDDLGLATGYGKNSCWNLYDHQGSWKHKLEKRKWATLVLYEYECDVIGPKGMLDLTLGYFMYDDSGKGNIINQGVQKLVRLENSVENKYTEETIYFRTGCGNVEDNRMEINQILQYLSTSATNATSSHDHYSNILQFTTAYRKFSLVKLIGGLYKFGEDIDTGYYGSIKNYGWDQYTDSSYNVTEGWKNDISLNSAGSSNVWSDDESTSKSYDLNNILWCSLGSSRRIKVRNYDVAGKSDYNRWITNFIDLSSNDSNVIIGGGYGRYPNTIDLPRSSANPYYSSIKPNGDANNPYTVSIDNFNTQENLNYFDASDNDVLSIDKAKGFRVYYKLLIPPIEDEEYEISYTFGSDTNSKTTFFRYPDMSGNLGDASNNLYANRKSETITLKWTKDSLNSETRDISINSIFFTDIASGSNKNPADISSNSTKLTNASVDADYDISFNVFQTHFFARNDSTQIVDTTRNEVPYTVKTFDVNSMDNQNIDISYVPIDYVPYRYFNYKNYKPVGYPLALTNNIFFDSSYEKPMVLLSEQLKYNNNKWYVDDNDLNNATIIEPSGSEVVVEKIIDISNLTDSYSVKQAVGGAAVDQQIAIFEGKIENVVEQHKVGLYYDGFVDNIFFELPAPNSLQLGNNFIPDYWRLPYKINTLHKSSGYQHFNTWAKQIQISMVFDILSLSLKLDGSSTKEITHMLINTHKNSTQYSALDEEGKLDSGRKVIFEVQGWAGTSTDNELNNRPIIVQLSAPSSGPFGTQGVKFIGNRVTNAPNSGGINVPYDGNESTFDITSILPGTMRKGNNTNNENLASTETAYNNIFDINIESWDSGLPQNQAFKGIIMSPSPLKVLLVDISSVIQSNQGQQNMLSDDNRSIIIIWSSFTFSTDPSWNDVSQRKSDIYWTVTRYNIATGKTDTLLSDKTIPISNEKYQFSDSNIRIYDKYNYTVSGIFKWTGITSLVPGATVPTISVIGFKTADCFICKFNRFPYGRYNTTSTNLKLYRPLLINTPEGQKDQFGNKTCGGGCSDPSRPGLNLFGGGSRISSSNNIYSNVTDQISKKQTYVILAKSKNRPFR